MSGIPKLRRVYGSDGGKEIMVGGRCRKCGKDLPEPQMVICSACYRPKGKLFTAKAKGKLEIGRGRA